MTYNSRNVQKTIPQRFSGIGFVILFHIGVIYVVASGLGHQAVEKIIGPTETRVIEEQKKPTDEAPPPPPKIETPPPFVPPPEIDIAPDITAAPTTAISVVQNTQKAAPVVVAAPSADVAPRQDPHHPNAIPDYPSASTRANEEGTVTLSLLVSENGRVTDAKVANSSGFPRLDEAAVNYSKARWHFVPGTHEGKPIAMWMQINVKFVLKK